MNQPVADPQALWIQVLSQLKLQMTRAVFEKWLVSSTGVDLDGDLLTVSVSSPQAKEAITQRLQHVIDDVAQRVHHGRPLRILFTIARAAKPPATSP